MRADTRVLPRDLLSGRSALIAGGTGNVGRHLVEAFLAAGATVVVPSRSTEKTRTLRASLSAAAGDRLITLEGNLSDPADAARIRDEALDRTGPLDAVVASLGGFVAAPAVLDAPLQDLRHAVDGYLLAHFVVAQAFMPALKEAGASYTFINGPLAYGALFPGTGLVSIATAAQAMLARVVMKEAGEAGPRVNELVLYTSFGWGDAHGPGPVSREDVGRYSAWLASDPGAGVRARSIHLKSLEPLDPVTEQH
jgi:3-oxoacyl-[acyl-carrier protein] reductase